MTNRQDRTKHEPSFGGVPIMTPASLQIWHEKYRYISDVGSESTIQETFQRAAMHAAQAEPISARPARLKQYNDVLTSFEFVPGGRILANAGIPGLHTDFNCFVMGAIDDSMTSIFDNMRESAVTLEHGGGIGHDFSTISPRGAKVPHPSTALSAGPVSLMHIWDSMCFNMLSMSRRPGAMMATLRCDHPDIEEFIAAKSDPTKLRHFNLSILVTDSFMTAVNSDLEWPLMFSGKVTKTVRAKHLWNKIMRATYQYAEPGVIFIDRVNRTNNLFYCETIHASNPCGEQMLPPYGACLLGSINLPLFVKNPFQANADLDTARIEHVVSIGVRFLDCIIDTSLYPLPQQKHEAQSKRRIGLGITGLADALIFCCAAYGSDKAVALTDRWLRTIKVAAYRASSELAKEKSSFPLYDAKLFLKSPNVSSLDRKTRTMLHENGIRNGTLTSIAPTGSTSLLAGNVSSGIEPVFALTQKRKIRTPAGPLRQELLHDFAYRVYAHQFSDQSTLPAYFRTTSDLSPHDHLAIQAAAQAHVDSAVSKTINLPEQISFDDFETVYLEAYRLGLKGCTTFRPNLTTGEILST